MNSSHDFVKPPVKHVPLDLLFFFAIIFVNQPLYCTCFNSVQNPHVSESWL